MSPSLLMPVPRTIAALDAVALTPIARAALDDASAEIVEWSVRRLLFECTNPTSDSLYRCSGLAQSHGSTQPWSAILKVGKSLADFEPLRMAPPELRERVLQEWLWDREAVVYQSGLLDHLPQGLRAPRCYGVDRVAHDRLWLWLEDLGDEPEPWTPAHFERAAHALGCLNGAYVGAVPPASWLAGGFLRGYVKYGVAGHHLPVFASPCSWEHPFVRRAFPEALVARLLGLWAERETLLDALDRLPRTLCHHDACRANLPQRPGPDGCLQVVAIDWAGAGAGAVGEDLGHLLASAVVHTRDIEPDQAGAFTELVLDRYVIGMRVAGWRGDERQALLGCLITAALRWAFSAPQVSVRPATWDAAVRQQGRPIDAIIEREATALFWLLELGDRARALTI